MTSFRLPFMTEPQNEAYYKFLLINHYYYLMLTMALDKTTSSNCKMDLYKLGDLLSGWAEVSISQTMINVMVFRWKHCLEQNITGTIKKKPQSGGKPQWSITVSHNYKKNIVIMTECLFHHSFLLIYLIFTDCWMCCRFISVNYA